MGIRLMSITLWKPEPDVLIHQALGKLAEECAELSHAVARCLIQGYHEEEPATHKLNGTQLMEEVADVKAAMRWLFDVLDEPFKGESDRERRKFDGFKRWQAMLEEDMAELPYQCDACSAPGYGPDAPCHCTPANQSRERVSPMDKQAVDSGEIGETP
jgi:hypothetical protein